MYWHFYTFKTWKALHRKFICIWSSTNNFTWYIIHKPVSWKCSFCCSHSPKGQRRSCLTAAADNFFRPAAADVGSSARRRRPCMGRQHAGAPLVLLWYSYICMFVAWKVTSVLDGLQWLIQTVHGIKFTHLLQGCELYMCMNRVNHVAELKHSVKRRV